ncbi:MAG: hypothetical protein ACI88L_000601 [Candidatus Paceibacteria bacterium]|jgi:hypothetical protein
MIDNMKTIIKKTILIPLIAMQMFFIPAVVFAATIIPDCNNVVIQAGLPNAGQFVTACNFGHFLELLSNVIRFIALNLTAPAIAVAIAYAGFLIMTSGGDTGKRKEAKEIFVKVGLGLMFIIGAWVLVHALYSGLGYGGFLQFTP